MTASIASYSPGHPWRRSGSIESIYSIQGHETDIVRDTTDTELDSDHEGVEYEPVTDAGEDLHIDDSSGSTDNDIIRTRVIAVSVRDGELLMADSERAPDSSDSDLDFHDYWHCASCHATNNNPKYRYCQKCFKVRKNLFPPRPRRKARPATAAPPPLSQDSGVETQSQSTPCDRKRKRSVSSDTGPKRSRPDRSSSDTRSDSCSDSEVEVTPLHKSVSDPAVQVDTPDPTQPDQNTDKSNLCITCLSEPKSGVFVHGRIAHICCCYKCAIKVWRRAKRCPICNSKVSNVLKAIVM